LIAEVAVLLNWVTRPDFILLAMNILMIKTKSNPTFKWNKT